MKCRTDSEKATGNSMSPPLTQFLRLLAKATVAGIKRRNQDELNRPTECKVTTQPIAYKGDLPDVADRHDAN
jgi:hypothetical protein